MSVVAKCGASAKIVYILTVYAEAYVLHTRAETLSRYSRHLRKEAGVEYHEGYFAEPEEAD